MPTCERFTTRFAAFRGALTDSLNSQGGSATHLILLDALSACSLKRPHGGIFIIMISTRAHARARGYQIRHHP